MAESESAVLTYRAPSSVTPGAAGPDLRLATPDDAVSKLFFDGFLTQSEVSAAALLLVAKVARTRFYEPPGMVAARIASADPVVTANADRLRFESFSPCCGVAARYDVLPAGLDRPPIAPGTTNVDLNPPLRAALAEVRGSEPLHLMVGVRQQRLEYPQPARSAERYRGRVEHKVPPAAISWRALAQRGPCKHILAVDLVRKSR